MIKEDTHHANTSKVLFSNIGRIPKTIGEMDKAGKGIVRTRR